MKFEIAVKNFCETFTDNHVLVFDNLDNTPIYYVTRDGGVALGEDFAKEVIKTLGLIGVGNDNYKCYKTANAVKKDLDNLQNDYNKKRIELNGLENEIRFIKNLLNNG